MNRFGVRLTVAAVALAMTAGAALADTGPVKKKRPDFFELLFGVHQSTGQQPVRRQPLFGNPWWQNSGDVRIVRGGMPGLSPSGRKALASDLDPESGSEGYGMGNLTYVPDKLVPLDGATFKETRPTVETEMAVYDTLSGSDLGLRVRSDERQAILDLYRSNGFKPLWIDKDKLSERAQGVLAVLAAAADEGMQPSNYLPPALADFDQAKNLTSSDEAQLAKLDLGLTAMAVKYAGDASGGQFDPRRLSRYNDITPERVVPQAALKVLAFSPFAGQYLKDLQPKHPAYAEMKKALVELRQETGGKTFEPIAAGDKVKAGASDERIPQVRARLAGLGSTVEAGDDPTLLDPALSAALKSFQKAEGIKASGNLDNATVNALNSDPTELHLRSLVDNMERLRWLPKNLGSRYVLVNQAAFEVRVLNHDAEVWRSKVIVGKPTTQTAVFNDEIEMVVFNPSWGVPPSIIANEYLPKLRRDPSYLDHLGFKVTTTTGQKIASSAIDWNAYGRKVPFNIEQPPGHKNALGELKFLFPNAHNIYMHDTPNRELFDEAVRDFSHGCVRVQNPREFATVLLGWDRSKVDANTDSKASQTVRLPHAVPIHIAYFTAWPGESGKIQYFDDVYGRDQAMENALNVTTLAQR